MPGRYAEAGRRGSTPHSAMRHGLRSRALWLLLVSVGDGISRLRSPVFANLARIIPSEMPRKDHTVVDTLHSI
jgi:hypothetical protein